MKKINNRQKKKKKKEDELCQWDALPNLALFNIFRNLHFKDRFGSIPFVCKSWNSIISDDPRCYSSMIPESISPDEAFIMNPDYYDPWSISPDEAFTMNPDYYSYVMDPWSISPDEPFIMNPDYYSWVMDPWSKLYTGRVSYLLGNFIIPSSSSPRRRRGHRRDPGISSLRNFIKKSLVGSSCSSSSTITSLCLGPFRFSYWDNEYEWVDHDEILYLIAHCCPNLKHISFDGFYSASIEAVLQVFQRCKKIELIDFSDSGYADSVQVIKEMGNCLPNLRGIRMAGWKKVIHDAIATHFPWIELNCEKRECYYRCVECDHVCFFPVLVRESLCRRLVHVNRPRFQHRYRRLCNQCWPSVVEEEEAFQEKVEALATEYEAESEYYRDLEEDQQYVRVVLRTRMRKKNMKQLEAASSFLMKMEMKMRKKTDTYDCQDFYDRE